MRDMVAGFLLGDLFQFDMTSTSWTQIMPTSPGAVAPLPRCSMGMVASGEKLYMFGGRGYAGALILFSICNISQLKYPLLRLFERS
jgi:hypothetical protein